ncbi:YD repeat-containing protein [Pseudomonas syringae pv. pisi]|nr:YD repeat-containing protein [Pseudomonas syringae pv. pisi]
MMRFHSPDSLSPFGAGGLNPYTYCLGNPIAWRDPTGHDASSQSGRLRRPDEDAIPAEMPGGMGIESWAMVAVGVVFTVLGAYATVATLGLATPVSGPVTVLGLSMSAQAAAYVTAGVLATGTTLSAASTAASAYGAATGNNTAIQAGQYLAYAGGALEFGGGFLQSAVKSAIKAGTKALGQGSKGIARSSSLRALDDLPIAPGRAARRGSAPANLAVPGGLGGDGLIPRARTSRPVPPQPNPRPTTGRNPRVDRRSTTNEASSSGPSLLAQRTAFTIPLPKLGPYVYRVTQIRR